MGSTALTVALLAVALIFLLLPYGALVRIFQSSPEFYARYPRRLLSEAYEGLQTGDLIFFRTAHPVTTASFTKSPFSHAGVVLREGGLVYFSETTGGSDYMPGAGGELFLPAGAVVAPLLPRLKHYRGTLYLAKLRRPLEAGAEERLKAAAEAAATAAVPYPSGLQFLAEAAFGPRATRLFGGAAAPRHCFFHSALLLEAAGIVPPGALSGGGSFASCAVVQALPKKEGGPYFPTEELVYDAGGAP